MTLNARRSSNISAHGPTSRIEMQRAVPHATPPRFPTPRFKYFDRHRSVSASARREQNRILHGDGGRKRLGEKRLKAIDTALADTVRKNAPTWCGWSTTRRVLRVGFRCSTWRLVRRSMLPAQCFQQIL